MTTFELTAGIVSTLAMTLYTEIAFALMRKPYHVVRILGNMLLFQQDTDVATFPPAPVLVIANIAHYAIGVVFAVVYNVLITSDEWRLLETLGYGLLIGTLAVIGWRLFFYFHPGPPRVSLSSYLVTIGSGHIVLSLVLYACLKVFG